MRLGIDVREACKPKRTGKGQWTFGFVRELLKRNLDLTLFSDAPLPKEISSLVTDRVRVLIVPAKGLKWHLHVARMLKREERVDVYVATVSYIVPFLLGTSVPYVPIVHDLIAFRDEPHDKRAQFIERMTLRRTVKNAAFICTVSETTKRDLLSRYSFVTPDHIIPIFADSLWNAPAASKKPNGPIVCIATLCPRKNQLRLIQAHTQLPDDIRSKHPLIIVGSRGWMDDEIVVLAEKIPGVEWKNYLSDDECKKLLSEASVFAYPSLYEGFGLPLLDAFRASVPVLTSNIGSMKEVAADAALLIDPLRVDAIAKGLEQLLANPELRTRLQANGKRRAQDFSWQKTVDLFVSRVKQIDKTA